jgi:chemotaxis protein methyltransferase CheR
VNALSREIKISGRAFQQIQGFFHRESGIHLPEHKKVLVVSRLHKRLEKLGLENFDAYCDYLSASSNQEERRHVVDLLTTNETYFFREPEHFRVLADRILPSISRTPLRVWCAAASSGEEPYSLAMLLADKLGNTGWELVASDLSGRMLDIAKQGLYPLRRMDNMPAEYLKRFCRKGTGEFQGAFMVDPRLQQQVRFVQHNLLHSAEELGMFDIIFVRNVMIYFDNQVKKQVLDHLLDRLRPGGWLVTSHAESLIGIDVPLKQVVPSVHQRV